MSQTTDEIVKNHGERLIKLEVIVSQHAMDISENKESYNGVRTDIIEIKRSQLQTKWIAICIAVALISDVIGIGEAIKLLLGMAQ